jgi:Sec-independent protein translocase protein TatA
MNFLGVGPLELIFILLIAIIVVGPRDLSKTARTLGRYLNRMYRSEAWRTITEASRTLRGLPNQLAREAALEELDEVGQSLNRTKEEMSRELSGIDEGMRAWTTPSKPKADEGSKVSDPPADIDTSTDTE